jgi:hypothetical protein
VDILHHGGNPYRDTTLLGWPPLWMIVLYCLDQASQFLNLSLSVLIRLFLMAVECGLVLVLFHILRQIGHGADAPRWLLIGIALNPVCILQVCQHGNFDVLVALWIAAALSALLAFWRTGRESDWLLACLFLGMGGLTKTVPLLLLPLCLIGFRRIEPAARTIGACLALGPAALGMAVLFVLTPDAVWQHVITYHALPGWFGLTGLIVHFAGSDALAAYVRIFQIAMVALVAAISWRALRRQPANGFETVFTAAALILMLYVFGTGYGPQYVYWAVPLLLICYADPAMRPWLRLTYAVGAATYIAEYAFVPNLGHFLTASPLLEAQWPQTLLRLPLFACYALLLAQILACHLQQPAISRS